MEKNSYKIKNIIIKSLLHDIDDKEKEILENWLDSKYENQNLYNKITSSNNIADKFLLMDSINVENSLLYNKKILKKSKQKKNIRKLITYTSSAAAIFIVAIALWNILFIPSIEKNGKIASITHGGNKAKLILGNGKEVRLESTTNIALRESSVDVKIQDNKVVYTPSSQNEISMINKIVTPHGGEYALTLADGTKVWLNSLSELKFPTVFNGKHRIVELKGEAYFEVAENKEKPFIVKLDNYDVKVLGTKFNINNYQNSTKSQTTLCSGKVEILPINQNIKPLILKPGNQLTLTRQTQEFNVINVETEVYTAWINGYYYFVNTNLDEILESLARWYKIQVFFVNKEANNRLFT